MTDWFISADHAITVTLFISTVGVAINALEDLYCKEVFSRSGFLSWEVLRTATKPLLLRPFWTSLDHLFEPSIFEKILWLRLFVSAGLLAALLTVPQSREVLLLLTAFILFTLLLLNSRTIFGLDGAHHMNLVVFIASTFFFLASAESFAAQFCLLFIGAQSVMSYVVSGIAKLTGSSWRKGDAIAGIMSTRIYGHKALGTLFIRHPALSTVTCWGVMCFQCSFVLTLFANEDVLVILLTLGFAFHAFNAVFMGLNGFFFSFMATYPAVVYLNRYIAGLG